MKAWGGDRYLTVDDGRIPNQSWSRRGDDESPTVAVKRQNGEEKGIFKRLLMISWDYRRVTTISERGPEKGVMIQGVGR